MLNFEIETDVTTMRKSLSQWRMNIWEFHVTIKNKLQSHERRISAIYLETWIV